jgi:hypothetical protein
MRYLKKFNEAISQEDLKDFCEQYLAYLLDEGYVLDFRLSGRVTQIEFTRPNTDRKTRSFTVRNGDVLVDWMDWDVIKDHFIPFLQMLDREYDIKENPISFQCGRAVRVLIDFQDIIDDKVKEMILTKSLDDWDKISVIRIPLLDHSVGQYSWQLKEAKEDWRRNFPDDELQEVCDRFLPYLYDEGFEVMVTIPPYFMFKKHLIRIWKEQETGNGSGVLDVKPFYWHEIKDQFLPLFDYLNKYYPLSTVKLVSYEPPRLGSSNKKVLTFRHDDSKEWTSKEDKANIMGFSILEEVMSRDNAYGRPMKIEEILIEVQNLGEL